MTGERRGDLVGARVERGEHRLDGAARVAPFPVGGDEQAAEHRGDAARAQVRDGVDALALGEHPGDLVVTFVHVAQVRGQQRWRALDQLHDRQVDRVPRRVARLFDEPGDGRVQRVAQRDERRLLRRPRVQLAHERVGVVLGERQRQVFLVREVPEERALGHVNRVGDLADGRLLVALGDEQRERGVNQGVAGLPLLPLPPLRLRRDRRRWHLLHTVRLPHRHFLSNVMSCKVSLTDIRLACSVSRGQGAGQPGSGQRGSGQQSSPGKQDRGAQ